MRHHKLFCYIMSLLFATFIISPLQFGTSNSGIVAKAACELTTEQIVNYFNSRVGETYASNACLAFVADGFQALGAERSSACCAYNYGLSHLSSTSRDIPIGADVFFTSEGCKYDYIDGNGHHSGHIGVYVGDGYIVHSYSSKIQKMLISTVESHGYTYWGWGYHGEINVIDRVIPAPSLSYEPVKESIMLSDDITFSWTSSGLNISGYNLYVAPQIEGTIYYDWDWKSSRNYIPGNSTLSYTYKAGHFKPGAYSAYIQAVDLDNNIVSDNSNYVFFVISNSKGKIELTPELSFEPQKNPISASEDITFSWTSSGLKISGYNLYVAPQIEGTIYYDWEREDIRNYIPGNSTLSYTYKAGELKPGAYAAYIQAWDIDADIESDKSNYVFFLIKEDKVKGDCNGDGSLTVADVIQLQKWILQMSNATLKDSNAADLNGDGVVDVFDLGLLKRAILTKKS